MSDLDSSQPYGSVSDLPTVQKIERELAAFEALGALMPTVNTGEIQALKRQHRELVDLVEGFYRLLGPRNWVFTEDLSVTEIGPIVATNDPVVAEEMLVDYYQSDKRISFQLLRLNRYADMKPRMLLLEKALADYQAGRYYSVVLVLLAVMDGFVNDVDKQNRQNLNARSAEDMIPWDSVAGHHLGLSHAHASFNKSVRKLDTAEATELFRNGIMHGMVVNFDNVLVATKAWNRLFAVVDWAEGRRKKAIPKKPEPSWGELATQFETRQDVKRRLAKWRAYDYMVSEVVSERTDLDRTCADFLERWERNQWGPLGQHFSVGVPRPSVGELAVSAKSMYQGHDLTDWKLERVFHRGASMAESQVRLEVNGERHTVLLRWVFSDLQGEQLFDWTPGGVWRLANYGPARFLGGL